MERLLFACMPSPPAIPSVYLRFRSWHPRPSSLALPSPSPIAMCAPSNRTFASASNNFPSWPPPSEAVLRIWHNAEAVCFDVDSTVCMDEGIDELGEFCGAGEAVAAWTSRAMGGSVPFEEALAARLSLFKPSLNDVEKFLASRPPKITPGIDELVKKLKSRGTFVYLVSGGFRQMIVPVAKILHIPEESIFANKLLFDKTGQYIGFDSDEPTARSGGKALAIAQIKQKYGYKRLVMVGDGATDLEARKPGGADIFICFGGVQLRESVAVQSDWCVQRFKDLIESLDQPQVLATV